MSDEERQERMLEILEELQELFPTMNNIATDDLSNPSFLMVADDNNFMAFEVLMKAAGSNVRQSTVEDELSDDPNIRKLLEWDDNDNNGNGTLQ